MKYFSFQHREPRNSFSAVQSQDLIPEQDTDIVDEVSVYGTRKGGYEMEVFLEDIEYRFNLRSIRKKSVLKRGRDLFLFMKWGAATKTVPYRSHGIRPITLAP